MMMGNPINKSGFASELMNLIPSYIKPAIYGSEDKNVIAKKEQAYRELFAGSSCAEKSKIKDALAYYSSSLSLFIETKDRLLEAFTRFFIGELYLRENELETAKEYFQIAYVIFDEKKNLMFIAAGQKIRDIERELKGEKPLFNPTQFVPFF